MSLEREDEHPPHGLGPCLVCFPGAPPPRSAASTSSSCRPTRSSQSVNRAHSLTRGLPSPLPALLPPPSRPLASLIKISQSRSRRPRGFALQVQFGSWFPYSIHQMSSNLQRFYYAAVIHDDGQAVTVVECEKKKFIFEIHIRKKTRLYLNTAFATRDRSCVFGVCLVV